MEKPKTEYRTQSDFRMKTDILTNSHINIQVFPLFREYNA